MYLLQDFIYSKGLCVWKTAFIALSSCQLKLVESLSQFDNSLKKLCPFSPQELSQQSEQCVAIVRIS